MLIVGIKGCPKCEKLKREFSDVRYVELPNFSIGFGDTFHKITKFFGFKTCPNCQVRRNKWNKWIPYFWRVKKMDPELIKIKAEVLHSGEIEFPVVFDNNKEVVDAYVLENPYSRSKTKWVSFK